MLVLQAVFEWWPAWLSWLYKIYWGLLWIAICALNFADFVFFSHKGLRLHGNDYLSWLTENFLTDLAELPLKHVLIFGAVSLLLLILGVFMVKEVRFGFWKDEFSPDKGSRMEVALRILLPLILVALAARGTLGLDPLNADNSQISSQKVINEMSLNPPWCLLEGPF